MHPYINPILVQKFIFYERNMHPHIHISWGKHVSLYLINYGQSCCPMFTSYEEIMHPYISCLTKEFFSHISVLYKYISVLHNSYINHISYQIIWTHEIDNMPIKTKNNVYVQHNSKSRNTYLYNSHETYIKIKYKNKTLDLIYNNQKIQYSFLFFCVGSLLIYAPLQW